MGTDPFLKPTTSFSGEIKMENDTDPFDLFDDSEDEAAELEDDPSSTMAKRLANDLMRKANAGTQEFADEGSQTRTSGASKKAITEDTFTIVEGLKWDDPDFIGPISIVRSGQDIGGGRKAISLEDISPGTLLLIEKPVASWSLEDNHLDLDFIQMIFSTCANVEQLLHWAEDLHPTKVDVDGMIHIKNSPSVEQIKQMMEDLDVEYSNDPEVEAIVERIASQNICNAQGTPFRREDLLRFLLAMRYNALETGLYVYTAMLNHSDRPNCVKFRGGELSEVRATRWIPKGEMLTISYVPTILCHAARRSHLWRQHRFDIGENPAENTLPMELIAGKIAPSCIVDDYCDSLTQRIENSLSALSSHLEELELSPRIDANQAIALELSSLELFNAALEQLQNDIHILLLPCLKLHVDACSLVQRSASMTFSGLVKLLERLVVSAMKLLDLQTMYHGPDHFDVARTDLDLAEAIGELKSRNAERLLRLEAEGIICSAAQWATYEGKLRRDYNRIKALYETQVPS